MGSAINFPAREEEKQAAVERPGDRQGMHRRERINGYSSGSDDDRTCLVSCAWLCCRVTL